MAADHGPGLSFPIFLKKSFHGNQFWGQIGDPMFIWDTGIPKQIAGSQFWFNINKYQWSSYIL